jgi:ABC-type glycerol-3-phosphate transport system substrate-binding protein
MLYIRKSTRFGRGTLLLMLAAVLVGCGGGRPTPAPPEPVTLRFGYYTNMADYEALAEIFHESHPHITVELVPAYNYRSNLALDVLDNTNLDVIRWYSSYPTPERRERLLPLDALMETSETFPRDDMYPGAMEALQMDGTQWAIPAGLNVWVVYCDPLWFQAAGITPPAADWTLDDLVVAAEAVGDADDSIYGLCSTPDRGDIFTLTRLLGGQTFDDPQNPTGPTLNTSANIDALQWYANLRHEYGVIPDLDRFQRQFGGYGVAVEGAVMRGVCGFWLATYASRDGALWGGGQLKWGSGRVMLPLPHSREQSTRLMWVDGYYILAQSAHPNEAWEWITFLLEHQEAAGQMIPPRLSQINSELYATRMGENVVQIARSLPDDLIVIGAEVDTNETVGAIAEMYQDVAEQAVRGELDSRAAIQNALDEAQAQAEILFVAGQ